MILHVCLSKNENNHSVKNTWLSVQLGFDTLDELVTMYFAGLTGTNTPKGYLNTTMLLTVPAN